MSDFSNLILVSDYDRTMSAFSGEIPAANLAAVDELIARGGLFTIATGRSFPMFARKRAGLRVNAPIILYNGAAVWNPETDEITVHDPMPDGWLDAVRTIHSRFPQLRMELQGLRGHCCVGRDALRDEYLKRNGVQSTYRSLDEVEDTVLSVSFYAPFQTVGHARTENSSAEEEAVFVQIQSLVETAYGDLFESMRSMPRMIELAPRGCGKGRTARWLAGRLGREVLCCAGDAPNDLPMLLEADEAFIPATADPAIMGRGFTEVASCDEGAIASIVSLLKSRPDLG